MKTQSYSCSGNPRARRWMILAMIITPLLVMAQFNIDWSTIDGGGGVITGGVYAVRGTIGQPDANTMPMTGGQYSLTGGFWAMLAVQTEAAPFLPIFITVVPPMVAGGDVALSFLTQSGVTYYVDWSTNLIDGPWIPATNFPGDGLTNTVLIPLMSDTTLFRVSTP